MITKPVVFISSTRDLQAARKLVGDVLYSMGYEPVWQDIEATDGGELIEVLRKRIEPCTIMVQLVGARYGAEPPKPTAEFGRVSYTQFEALYAEKLGRKVIYHFLDPTYPAETSSIELEDRRSLQAAYRQRIRDANKLRQSGIATEQSLELSIRRINDELAASRKLSDARFRRMLRLTVGTISGMAIVAALVAGGFYLVQRNQVEQSAKLDQQNAKTTNQSQQLERIEQLMIAQKQVNPQAAPVLSAADQAILEEARKQGDLKSRATASVLKPDANTDALLAQLKAQQAAQEFDLSMLEGKRWNFEKPPQLDKAIPFFERAMQLRPDSFDARTYAAIAHSSARFGDIADHQKRAIDNFQGTLKLVPPDSFNWAATQDNLGIAWDNIPTGDRANNLRAAIECYTRALQVFTRAQYPQQWAAAQNNLGIAWNKIETGDPTKNLQTAIDFYTRALEVYTWADFPELWGVTLFNLGNAWLKLPSGDRVKSLQIAIECYTRALKVRTKAHFPDDWAGTQCNLIIALAQLSDQPNLPADQDRCDLFRRAIASEKGVLTVYTATSFPQQNADASKDMKTFRRAYEAAACAEKIPFDDIEPAK